MLTIRSPFATALALLLVLSIVLGVHAAPSPAPQRKKAKGKGGAAATKLTSQQQAAKIPQGISEATDGSTILDMTATVK